MPTLDWIGKKAVIGHHREVRHHFLCCNGELSEDAGDHGSLLVQGDNLLALKALMPYYAGKCWVRNLERGESSFWIQTSTDKFYPDFVAELHDGRIQVVEYKSSRDWSNDDSREKRALGELWAEHSAGKCVFVVPKGPDWDALKTSVGKASPARKS